MSKELERVALTLDKLFKFLNGDFMVTLILLLHIRVLIPHRTYLILYLCLLKQLIDLQIHLLELSDQIKVLLLKSH